MTLKRRPRLSHGESSAQSDLAFLLIIYFIAIAGFNVNRGFLVNLPAKDSTRFLLQEDILRYELDQGGALSIRGQSATFAVAEQQIAQAIAARPNLALVLAIDPRCPWQEVVSFVEIAQKLKVEAFSFSIKAPSAAAEVSP
jgi:biopolymer transport protein ExbD